MSLDGTDPKTFITDGLVRYRREPDGRGRYILVDDHARAPHERVMAADLDLRQADRLLKALDHLHRWELAQAERPDDDPF